MPHSGLTGTVKGVALKRLWLSAYAGSNPVPCTTMINLDAAIKLLKEHSTRESIFKHSLAVGAIMRGLARHLGEDENKWEICGILHDIDFPQTENDYTKHGLIAAEILKDVDLPEDIIYAIKAHAHVMNKQAPLKSKMDFSIDAADAVSGLVTATALIYPDKKLASVKLKSISKRFKEVSFVRNCDRNRMLSCEKVGISKEKLFEIALESLKTISGELGL